jgi:hypothetical protein
MHRARRMRRSDRSRHRRGCLTDACRRCRCSIARGLPAALHRRTLCPSRCVRLWVERGLKHTHHAQALALVRVYQVCEDLGRGGNGYAALVSELVEAALHAEVCEPVLAVLHVSVFAHARR